MQMPLPVTLNFKKSFGTLKLLEQLLAANMCPLLKKRGESDPNSYRWYLLHLSFTKF